VLQEKSKHIYTTEADKSTVSSWTVSSHPSEDVKVSVFDHEATAKAKAIGIRPKIPGAKLQKNN